MNCREYVSLYSFFCRGMCWEFTVNGEKKIDSMD